LLNVHSPLLTAPYLLPTTLHHYPLSTAQCQLHSTVYQLHSRNLCPPSANLNYFLQAVALLKKLGEKTEDSGHWTVDIKQWTVSSGQQTVGSKQ
jgi:hypothetical protein